MVRMPHWPVPRERSGINYELTRMQQILKLLGNPQLYLPPVIHVAGTNGKGSTCAFLRSIFEAAGYKVHMYSSPHLINYNERIYLAGQNINDEYLYYLAEKCRIICEKANINPTFFEGTTSMAFEAFKEIKADIVILETGLGGRLDATNLIEEPIATVITTISYDHTEFLGNNLTLIANEKAGIMKKNSPCIISQQYDEVFVALERRALELEIETFKFEYDWGVSKEKNMLHFYANKVALTLPSPGLIGDHQFINAGNAIATIQKISHFKIDQHEIANGLLNVRWPARLQRLKNGFITNDLPNHCEIWVDGAHNDAGAHILKIWLQEHKEVPTFLVCGMSKGRDAKRFLSFFKDLVEFVAAVPVNAEPLSYEAEEIYHASILHNIKSNKYEDVEEAISAIIAFNNQPKKILICGSLFLAGDVLNRNQKISSI